YRKDRYGFNNDDSIYAFKNPLMIVGGSFAMGSCVHQDETIQGVLRRNGYPTISTGIGASGAFAALGVLKEYGEVFKPPVVLWQFGDPNDIILLSQRELRSRSLMRYLSDDFSQDLIHRQAEVDALWVDWWHWVHAQKSFESDPAQQAAWNKLLDDNLPL